MLGRRLNPTIHRYEDVELIEVHSEYLECCFLVAKDEWESGKTLLNLFSPLDGNVLGFPHYRLHLDNISAAGPKLPDGTTAQPGMADMVQYLGFVSGDQKHQLLREADLFCFPTYYENENQPVNLIEAMAFGLPILTTRWRSPPSCSRPTIPAWSISAPRSRLPTACWR